MKNISKKFFALFAVLCMVLTMLPVQVFAAGKMYIDTPAAAVAPGHSIIIGLHNPKKNVKWTASDDSVASIKCLRTTYDKYTRTYVAKVKVTAKKAGIIDIKAKCGKKKYSCRLTVIDTLKTRINYSSKTVRKGESFFLQRALCLLPCVLAEFVVLTDHIKMTCQRSFSLLFSNNICRADNKRSLCKTEALFSLLHTRIHTFFFF